MSDETEANGQREEPVSESEGPAPEVEEQVEPPTPEEVAVTAHEFLTGLLETLGVDGEVATRVDGETAHVDVSGDDLGALIGRRGQSLDALQEITRTAVQRRLRHRVRLLLDVEGYRARRREALADHARSMAERAKERGSEIEFEPMNAYERKIVHDAIAEIDGTESFSEGEEPDRKVIVRAL